MLTIRHTPAAASAFHVDRGCRPGAFSVDTLSITNNNLPFGDNFNPAPNQQLSNSWTGTSGIFLVNGGKATGAAATSAAFVNGINASDVFVQGDAAPLTAAGQYIGLAARQTGGNLYIAYYGSDGNSPIVFIDKYVNGQIRRCWPGANWQCDGGTFRFELAGNQLNLFLANVLVATAYDNSFTSGGVGMVSLGGASIDNFGTNVSPLTNPSLPFTDTFNAPVNNQLGSNWTSGSKPLCCCKRRGHRREWFCLGGG